jgi:hypothetical protein
MDLLAMTFLNHSSLIALQPLTSYATVDGQKMFCGYTKFPLRPLHFSCDKNTIALSRVWSVTIDGVWIEDRV